MQSNCIREASKACFNTCCLNPLLSLPAELHTSGPTKSTAADVIDPRRDFVSAILSSIQPNATFTNHESLPPSTELFANLKNAVPHYLNTVLADHIRAQEYHHLSNQARLDYIGHGLFSDSQKHESPFFDISYSSTSLSSYLLHGGQESEFQSKTRKRIARYMNVFEEDYSLVFTANQTSAFKILADSYPFRSDRNLLTVYDYENEAVQAMVESATRRGARAQSAIFTWPGFKVNSRKLRKIVINKSRPKNRGLFAFPLQSRMTGSRYSYQWMNLARDNGWHVLLDASALGAKDMETLGLSLFQPDFLICSFFKIFGENPSGFCCLFIKKSKISDLSQSDTSMGIISITPTTEKAENAENQTTPFSSSTSQQQEKATTSEIVELDENPIECRALDHADKLGLILISSRLRCLINWLVNALLTLRHPHSGTGLQLVRIYGPRIKLDRGPALAFNVYDWKGERVDPVLVQKLADRNNISLSTGFLRNIWFSDNFQEDKDRVLENNASVKKKGKQDLGVFVVSVSLGMLSNFEDMYRVWGFVSRFLDADFVEKERWRYTALNQTTVEL
ncbi:molybdenum cofactor sulfurase [Phtheirospermum japonicum]|uniref:Molybdenum cofactor sulfurase n=1 Tax=Phtheirospermum japonicum TaxID=374723 RepID=A0A830CFD2_9LAMI|nr:molybdenum cofactor sulfurase [Phtheirospermum japonicum]